MLQAAEQRPELVRAPAPPPAISWAYLLAGAGMDMPSMGGMLMPKAAPIWTHGHFALTLTMWAVMMAAMMLPRATPMLLLYD